MKSFFFLKRMLRFALCSPTPKDQYLVSFPIALKLLQLKSAYDEEFYYNHECEFHIHVLIFGQEFHLGMKSKLVI